MAILPILQFPDRGLRIKADKVMAADDISPGLIENMFETMYAEPGLGLAATQVNVHQQIIVLDISESCNQPYVLINPVVLERSGEISIQEGCLSVPGVRELVPRAARLRISALDRHWRPFELAADDLLAICIQHEIDHLNGVLFIDYLSPLKRQRLQEKMEKNAKRVARANSKRQ